MNQPLRVSSAASLIVFGSLIAGCATHQARFSAATELGGRTDADVGVATRAMAALNANHPAEAVELAERAVARTPNDAGFRALLGNSYFAAGRFASAESAFRDSLTLYPSQPKIVLRLALVQIAQGKTAQAINALNTGRDVLDASDYGLALALAGRPAQAIAVLDPAARQTGADATVRQNLALAHALSGDWAQARTIAAQDVPAGLLDARIQQWMQLAKPAHAADQVAALVGVKPAASDAGQPTKLALSNTDTRVAFATAQAPEVDIAQAAPAPTPKPAFAEAVASAPAPVVAIAPAPPPARSTLATFAAAAVADVKAVIAAFVPYHAPVAKPASVMHAAARPALRSGKSSIVVQLGAYQSPERAAVAWSHTARKYGALKAYLPLSARFASPKGTFYRLSVRGFASVAEANSLCGSLQRQGGSCFVRNLAGDAPVHYAAA